MSFLFAHIWLFICLGWILLERYDIATCAAVIAVFFNISRWGEESK